jgi:hypothetical protein
MSQTSLYQNIFKFSVLQTFPKKNPFTSDGVEPICKELAQMMSVRFECLAATKTDITFIWSMILANLAVGPNASEGLLPLSSC